MKDTIPAPPPDTMTHSEMTRADLLNLQDKWQRARQCLLVAEDVWSRYAVIADAQGDYDVASIYREHALVMKMIRMGNPPKIVFETKMQHKDQQ